MYFELMPILLVLFVCVCRVSCVSFVCVCVCVCVCVSFFFINSSCIYYSRHMTIIFNFYYSIKFRLTQATVLSSISSSKLFLSSCALLLIHIYWYLLN